MTDVVEPLGHDHQGVVTDPTCTESGYTTYICHCGDSYVADYVEPRHSYGEWYTKTAATCTTAGEQRRDCTACGHYETELIDATGHNYVDGECTDCGESEVKGLLGDLNGDGRVNSSDLNMLYRYNQEDLELDDFQLRCADINQDGRVNSSDLNMLYRYNQEDETLTWQPIELS